MVKIEIRRHSKIVLKANSQLIATWQKRTNLYPMVTNRNIHTSMDPRLLDLLFPNNLLDDLTALYRSPTTPTPIRSYLCPLLLHLRNSCLHYTWSSLIHLSSLSPTPPPLSSFPPNSKPPHLPYPPQWSEPNPNPMLISFHSTKLISCPSDMYNRLSRTTFLDIQWVFT